MDQPHAAQQGVPPLQHPRQSGLIHSQTPNSPRQPSIQQRSPAQGPYISPHPSTQGLPPQQYQSPYIGTGPTIHQHHPGETTFFGAHPSPYSTHSAAGSYASSEPGENMGTQTTMSRQQYPPISSYQTPQSNSPASIHSPQTDAHGRPFYGMASMPQHMYYQPSYQMQQSAYTQHQPATHHASLTNGPTPIISYQQQQQQPQPMQAQSQQHHSSQPQPGMIDTKSSLGAMQRPSSVIAPPQNTPQTPSSAQGAASGSQGLSASLHGTNSSAAPGPIPATTPLVVRQDHNGVQWIAFEYSRDRVKMEYTIRCDVESVNTDELSSEFKSANCVYPRACCNKDQYKGNRLHYESECNAVGWALAQLNPPLREKRGLIQRAVDSWRNSNQDVRLRSRRVRRMAKIQTRKGPSMGPGSGGGQQLTPQSSVNGVSPSAQANDYGSAPAHHHQQPKREESMSSASTTTPRLTQNFYPNYPQQSTMGGGQMPPMASPIGPMHPHNSAMSSSSVKREDEEESRKRTLFGDVPESKRRKFILVEDGQRGTRVRVRVSLDQVKMDDMPDAHLKINSVYPRSYYPRQSGSPPESSSNVFDDEESEEEGVAGSAPTRGKTMVSIPIMDGAETKMAVPRMTRSRRSREVALNEIGYRMSWGQARAFNGRTLFLQRSLDAYRNKMRSTMLNAGQDIASTAPHFETRIGKRRWSDRTKRNGRGDSP